MKCTLCMYCLTIFWITDGNFSSQALQSSPHAACKTEAVYAAVMLITACRFTKLHAEVPLRNPLTKRYCEGYFGLKRQQANATCASALTFKNECNLQSKLTLIKKHVNALRGWISGVTTCEQLKCVGCRRLRSQGQTTPTMEIDSHRSCINTLPKTY